jgi:hypothetical protein
MALTLTNLRRTLALTMPAGFDAASRVTEFYTAFARVKELVADFRANERFCVQHSTRRQNHANKP